MERRTERMKTITGLRAQRRKEDRVNVYLDGEYAFSLHVSVANGLQVGQQLGDDQCERLRMEDAVPVATQRALRFLSYRPRSRAELERYLRDKEVAPEVIDTVISQLEAAGYVDDAAFAEFWVRNREDFRPKSVWVLRGELRNKGISDEVIDQAVESIDEEESAYKAAQSQAYRLANQEYQVFRRRLGGFLQRRGFNYSVVKQVVERLWSECSGDQQDARDNEMDFGPGAKDTI